MGMSNLSSFEPQTSARGLVIGAVRAEMARRNVNASKLARATDTKQQYWSRRLTGITPFDIDDLATLSFVLQVPMSAFTPDIIPSEAELMTAPTYDGPRALSEPEAKITVR